MTYFAQNFVTRTHWSAEDAVTGFLLQRKNRQSQFAFQACWILIEYAWALICFCFFFLYQLAAYD